MSNVNIMRVVDNIRSGTNAYTPLVETVVNAIQAIEATAASRPDIQITIDRSPQIEFDDGLATIRGFEVADNGIGFNEENRAAFDTLYTTHKLSEGGKGFGRFTFLKYFEDVFIESTFAEEGAYRRRCFRMGKGTDLIVDEAVTPASTTSRGTTVRLEGVRAPFPDKALLTIARTLVEKLLPYFISEEPSCPRIVLQERDKSECVVLNDYLTSADDPLIKEVAGARGEFELSGADGPQRFFARVFKLYSPHVKRSRVNLVAHRREVTSTSLHNFIPEFAEEFIDAIEVGGRTRERNFVVAVYVFGDYLDANVSVERGGFEFQRDSDLLMGISQREIERAAALLGKVPVEGEVQSRQARKIEKIKEYVRDKAPWHSLAIREADLSAVPLGATEEEIDAHLHRVKYEREVRTKSEVRKVLAANAPHELQLRAAELVREVSENSRSELVHYVALRRSVLDILSRSLERDSDGRYRSESVVHDVIFPLRRSSDDTAFHDHNLWILDERLNFMEYVSSDIPLQEGASDRPDLLAFGRRIGFRGGNEPSNPVMVFELKKPGRDDFVNPSSKEDPVEQIIRYVQQIRAGKYRTPKGRELRVEASTPFYGYVVCDLTAKVRTWVEDLKDFTPMPDRLGYFRWHGNLNLHLEVLGWEKVLSDARERNGVFFHKLGLE